MARQNQDQTSDRSVDEADTLSDADKQALRDQAAQANAVPQFQDDLDATAEQNDQAQGQTQQ